MRFCIRCESARSAREERDRLRSFGMTWGSAQILQNERNKWRARKFSPRMIERLLRAIHPVLMANLKVGRYAATLVVKSKKLRWLRRGEWVPAAEERKITRERQRQYQRAYEANLKRARRGKREWEKRRRRRRIVNK